MLKDLAISALESALTYTVSHAIIRHREWHDLYDKPFLLRFEQPNMALYCVLREQSVILREARPHDSVTVSIRSDYATFLRVLRGHRSHKTITIQGQSRIANLLLRYIKKFRPDLESMLATVIGESPAYAVTSQIHQGVHRLQKDMHHLCYSSGEYLAHECKLTPGKMELRRFYHDVDQLHNQVELLAQRLLSLEKHQEDFT